LMQKTKTESLASIVNRNQEFKQSIDYSPSSIDVNKRVDMQLHDCSDLIDEKYKPWFAKRFFRIQPHRVAVAASATRETARYQPATNTQKLFTMLIRKEAGF